MIRFIMAKKYILDLVFYTFSAFICLTVGSKLNEGKYSVVSAPSYIQYVEGPVSTLRISQLSSLIRTLYGFNTQEGLEWNGLAESSPFKRPKGQIVISIPTGAVTQKIADSISEESRISYKTENDMPTDSLITEEVSKFIQLITSDQGVLVDFSMQNALFNLQASRPTLFGHLPISRENIEALFTNSVSLPITPASLNVTLTEDAKFLGQAFLIQAIMESMLAKPELAKDAFPDFFHFELSGFLSVLEKHGENSPQVQDAQRIILELIETVKEAMATLYGNNAVLHVVTFPTASPERAGRQARSLQQSNEPNVDNLNLAKSFSSDFPVYFNIILWFIVLMIVFITAIAYGIWNMDPGSDSIIYRMTSQRIKRD